MANQPASDKPIADPTNGNTQRDGSRIEAGAERFKEGTTQTVQAAKQKFDAAADRVEQGMHSATDTSARAAMRATEKASEVRERSREALQEARERSREIAGDARDRASDALDAVRVFVRERPVQSVAIALAAGWVLGRVLGGRR